MKRATKINPRVVIGLTICTMLIVILVQTPQSAGPQSVALHFLGHDLARPGKLAFEVENHGPARITLDACVYEIKSPSGILMVANGVDFASPTRREGPNLRKGESMIISLSDAGVEGRGRLIYAVDMSLHESASIFFRDIVPEMIKRRSWIGFRRKVATVTVSDWLSPTETNELFRP